MEKKLTLEEQILVEGLPFQLKLSTLVNSTVEATFTLDDDDYDIDGDNTDNTTPFKNMLLLITGYEIIADTNIVLDYFALDNNVVIDGGKEGFVANQDLHVNGRAKGTGSTDINYPSVKDLHGLFALICRGEIAIKASATAALETLDLYLYGHYVRRNK